jgi:hypothetical protein
MRAGAQRRARVHHLLPVQPRPCQHRPARPQPPHPGGCGAVGVGRLRHGAALQPRRRQGLELLVVGGQHALQPHLLHGHLLLCAGEARPCAVQPPLEAGLVVGACGGAQPPAGDAATRPNSQHVLCMCGCGVWWGAGRRTSPPAPHTAGGAEGGECRPLRRQHPAPGPLRPCPANAAANPRKPHTASSPVVARSRRRSLQPAAARQASSPTRTPATPSASSSPRAGRRRQAQPGAVLPEREPGVRQLPAQRPGRDFRWRHGQVGAAGRGTAHLQAAHQPDQVCGLAAARLGWAHAAEWRAVRGGGAWLGAPHQQPGRPGAGSCGWQLARPAARQPALLGLQALHPACALQGLAALPWPPADPL